MTDLLVPGGVVGVICTEFLAVVKKAIGKIKMFNDRLKSIQSALNDLKPKIEEMERLNDRLAISNEELAGIRVLLVEGKILVENCMKITKWNLSEKHKYSGRLLDLDNKIQQFCQFSVLTTVARDTKALRVDVTEIHCKIDRLSALVVENRIKITPFKSCNVPEGPDFVVGLDVSFKTVKEKLLNEIEHVVIISAAGGYGKTTLVKKLCYDDDVLGKYTDNIIFIVVSESPNLMTIVQKIVKHLKEAVPETDNEDDAIQILQQLLAKKAEKNPILLILDDFWSSSESILKKFVFEKIKNYKVLVTSRFKFPNIGSAHKLEGLEHEDAVKLLSYSATPLVGSYILPDEKIVDKVVKRCKGSPLALIVIGRSLCGKHKSAWQSKLNEWSDGMSLIDAANSEILGVLMNSLKDLDGSIELRRIKQFFLDLGSFPEDHRIPVTVLIDMWSELHGLDGNGVDIVAAIHELSARSLADLIVKREDISEGDGYYNDMYVTQHDLLRDLAIHYNNQGLLEERERLNLNIRKNSLPEFFLKKQKQTLKARLMSISTDEEFSSTWPDLELPEVEVLVLNFMATKINYALPGFIKNMAKLRTLVITNNGPDLVELANFHLISSLTNLKKIRLEHIKIPSLTTKNNGLCLNNLEKISAFHCDISKEIQTSDLQIHEVFPKLEEIDISYCSSLKNLLVAICKANSLKKMSISDCHNLFELPEEIGKLLELQVLRLNGCSDLKTLPNSIGYLKNLHFLDISNCAYISQLPFEELRQLEEFHINRCPSLSISRSSASKLDQLEHLIVDKEQNVKYKEFFKKNPKLMKVAVDVVNSA